MLLTNATHMSGGGKNLVSPLSFSDFLGLLSCLLPEHSEDRMFHLPLQHSVLPPC